MKKVLLVVLIISSIVFIVALALILTNEKSMNKISGFFWQSPTPTPTETVTNTETVTSSFTVTLTNTPVMVLEQDYYQPQVVAIKAPDIIIAKPPTPRDTMAPAFYYTWAADQTYYAQTWEAGY